MERDILKKDILEEIVAAKRKEVARQKEAEGVNASTFAARCAVLDGKVQGKRSMRRSIINSPSGIIAEFKRKSPSKGWINREADLPSIISAYERAGAAALSVLTDAPYFGGSLHDLRRTGQVTNLPVLRKDFIIDPYQLYQARAAGADAVLLIAAALTPAECKHLGSCARELGLEVLLEIHREEELDYIDDFTDMVGVNNRNLGTFRTDVSNSFRLAEKLPREKVWVSESGISDVRTVKRLKEAGFRGFLIGETFMKTISPGRALEDLLGKISADAFCGGEAEVMARARSTVGKKD